MAEAGAVPSQQSQIQSQDGPGEGSKGHASLKNRKRTKTGCLTCRKRRIKCDEGRPECHNCYKSRRQCEGYQTRLQFKAQGGDFGAAGLRYTLDGPMEQYRQNMYGAQGHFAHIQPRPMQQPYHSHPMSSPAPAQWAYGPPPMSAQPGIDPSYVAAQMQFPASAPLYMDNFSATIGPAQPMPYVYQQPINSQDLPNGMIPADHLAIPQDFATVASNVQTAEVLAPEQSHFLQVPPNPISVEGYIWNPSLQAYDPNTYTTIPKEQFEWTGTILEEELFDVDSDEELGYALDHQDQSGLPLMLSVHGNFNVKALRTHDTFLNTPNILANYEPQWHASPLVNPTTARIFGHFIAVTACHLSLGQRRASNPSLLFQQQAPPKSQQGLWTYILPQKALSNQGLMHAMLALASLQIAMLQRTDRHTARKHYHFAIRRNKKAVGLPKKRTSVATIATTLLLACFEVWAADHSNWNSHLIGARQLLLEVDFKERTKQIRDGRKREVSIVNWDDPYAIYLHHRAGPIYQADIPDENLLELFMGYKVPYGEHVTGGEQEPDRVSLTQADVDAYDVYADLLWFYLKQDIYYSTISSKPLLLPYDRWGGCPPRAPLARIDAIYGTSDHLILIFGRIARFISKDLARKKRSVAASGGSWRPPPGMFPNRPPGPPGGPPGGAATKAGVPGGFVGGNPGPANASNSGGPPASQGPSFMGMVPSPPTPKMPQAFMDAPRDRVYIPAETEEPEDDNDPQIALKEALAEWSDIQTALSAFESALSGIEWQPLPIQAAMPIATHFGSALQYGDYRIADIWAMFYTAKIIMARVHPHMPPAALMAAGVCAAQTATWANRIGKIVFGMQAPAENDALNPTFASVLTQNMYCLFVAGVQYLEPAQRLVTVQRLQYIAEKVGHESSALAASGLETCWINAFQMGRGPEWRRTLGLVIDMEKDETRKKEFKALGRDKDNTTVYIKGDGALRRDFGMGILSLESDFAVMKVNDEGGQ